MRSGPGEMTVERFDQSAVVLVISVVTPFALEPWMVVVEGEPEMKIEMDLASATENTSEVISDTVFVE